MALRIIGGEHRSRLLRTPGGRGTRPTRSLVREAAFNMIQGRVAGGRVLDLFAGSGAMGFEALSRGAAYAVFADRDREAAEAITANAKALRLEGRCECLRMDWRSAVLALNGTASRFDLIFLDPPYSQALGEVLGALAASGLLAREGVIVAEHASAMRPETAQGLRAIRTRAYGESALTVYELEETFDEGDFPRQL